MRKAERVALRKLGRLAVVAGAVGAAVTASLVASAGASTAARARPGATTTVSTQHGKLGVMLAAANGHTLYISSTDKRNVTNCNGSCANVWMPLTATGQVAAAKGSGVKQQLLGTIRRSDARHQVTYNGHPLYLFRSDKKAGQMNGEGAKGFSATWDAVTTSGNALKPKQTSVCNPLCPGY